MAFWFIPTLVGIAADYGYSKWQESKEREKLARSMKGYGNVKGLNPAVKQYAQVLVEYLRSEFGYPAFVQEGKRSKQRQRQLYSMGRTVPGEIVTWTLDSKHLTGLAFDIGFSGYSPDDVPRSWWQDAGEAWEALGGVWGGRWAVADKMHFEA